MTHYRARFFKDLLSSDGHPFKCLQRTIEIRAARNADRASKAAQRRYERVTRVRDWKLRADLMEMEAVDSGIGR
jgi:hypothetical protein